MDRQKVLTQVRYWGISPSDIRFNTNPNNTEIEGKTIAHDTVDFKVSVYLGSTGLKNIKDFGVNFGEIIGGPSGAGSFAVNDNTLKTLEGSPHKVGRNFRCDNNHLTSLVGGPKWVGGSYNCNSNNLTSLEGLPMYIGGNFSCSENPELWRYIVAKNYDLKIVEFVLEGMGLICWREMWTNNMPIPVKRGIAYKVEKSPLPQRVSIGKI